MDKYRELWKRNSHEKKISIVLFLAFGITLSVMAYDTEPEGQGYIEGSKGCALEEEQREKFQTAVDEVNGTIEEYLPGIICWGDSLTQGLEVNYPTVLSDLIKEKIIDEISFENVVDPGYEYLIEEEQYSVKVPKVVNMGVARETSITIAGRAGGIPYITSEDIIIPSQKSAVELPIISSDGKKVIPYNPGECGLEEIKISGGYGSLSVQIDEATQERTYYFTRKEVGDIIEIPAGAEIETYGATHYLDYLPVVYIGTNGGYDDVQDLIEQQRAIIDQYVKNGERFIVIGIHIGTKKEREELETAMVEEYGDKYINLREYMSTCGIDDANELLDAGIRVTDYDKEMIEAGKAPASLLKEDELHFNAYGYELIGNLIYERMDQLGYLDGLQQAIGEITHCS